MASGPRLDALLLELDAEYAHQRLLRAPYVREDHTLAPCIFDAGIDECDRAPDQVDECVHQLLLCGKRRKRPDQLRRHSVISVAVGDVRPQIGQPPMLVANASAELTY